MNDKHLGIIALLVLLAIALYCTHATRSRDDAVRFTVYGSMRCGYTVKMLDHLKSVGASHEFVDVNRPDGDAAFKEVTKGKNIRGIPFSVDHKTGEEIAGFREIIL
jgi:glutaredoxin-related protein